jgi:hypothetical protein
VFVVAQLKIVGDKGAVHAEVWPLEGKDTRLQSHAEAEPGSCLSCWTSCLAGY